MAGVRKSTISSIVEDKGEEKYSQKKARNNSEKIQKDTSLNEISQKIFIKRESKPHIRLSLKQQLPLQITNQIGNYDESKSGFQQKPRKSTLSPSFQKHGNFMEKLQSKLEKEKAKQEENNINLQQLNTKGTNKRYQSCPNNIQNQLSFDEQKKRSNDNNQRNSSLTERNRFNVNKFGLGDMRKILRFSHALNQEEQSNNKMNLQNTLKLRQNTPSKKRASSNPLESIIMLSNKQLAQQNKNKEESKKNFNSTHLPTPLKIVHCSSFSLIRPNNSLRNLQNYYKMNYDDNLDKSFMLSDNQSNLSYEHSFTPLSSNRNLKNLSDLGGKKRNIQSENILPNNIPKKKVQFSSFINKMQYEPNQEFLSDFSKTKKEQMISGESSSSLSESCEGTKKNTLSSAPLNMKNLKKNVLQVCLEQIQSNFEQNQKHLQINSFIKSPESTLLRVIFKQNKPVSSSKISSQNLLHYAKS